MADDTNARLEAMADLLGMTLKELIEIAESCGLEIIATRARKTDQRPGGHL